ncbi:hypothetical protein OUZ56_018466 [Daphnia magna]|uniref:Uncharacterized protein n=1 Tax=Daphnia magna TaxID=35525 RepID=A0ABQ9Z8W9_9CRUS|nr:hypothetical protein OUZ56_018466 [Daphnia magna]
MLNFNYPVPMVNVVVCYDQPGSMENAYQRKYDKYSSHGRILPLVVGSLGSWHPRNDEIHSILGINGRSGNAFRFKAQLAAIQGSMDCWNCNHAVHRIGFYLAEPLTYTSGLVAECYGPS